ncbi:DUF1223 domain-containing protein [Aquibium sp. A9E412]|uniref:DUF1223 domain-containing protein n=1 Tax=Aquibium sp. A9E412 TaxID=2976767 RepID=UPI0025AF3799|nr:DUF1223 domain-containing protein [Aquibium sp. A9E412]MDN2565642.1 DUF1223 domain-containing protein [Aquibium sp. A9E412]
MTSRRDCLRLAAAAAAWPLAARAQTATPPVRGVVELFTSQGCSACPPADALLGEWARSDDVVALGYHVDYWDYLGWKDTFASPQNTQRQRDYAARLDGSVYTPQAVVNGGVHLVGSHREAIEARLAAEAPLPVPVVVRETGPTIVIETGAADGHAAHVVLAYFKPRAAVDVARGENRGRRLTYWNVVTDLHTVGMWHGRAQRYELPASELARKGASGCAVLLQTADAAGRPGRVLGAAATGGAGR